MPTRKTRHPYEPVPDDGRLTLGDHRRYPGSVVLLTCAMCGWAKPYSPERLLDRLRELKAGGHPTPVGALARRVAWPCPMCQRVRWRMELARPRGLDPREARRLAGLYRN
ncbi:hypothetical protein [Phenylobacterium soli]|uniref:Uncharacterized protein n=1 Tax=Phenylobacterium soli TaxID=2170551 RepID=A0A328AFI8_9CAUL|nr:hypothetical protein [Phenylobacterium soli]RAK53295.1 hypothetical protein DJ017_01500 [Phenylobacterium soli]